MLSLIRRIIDNPFRCGCSLLGLLFFGLGCGEWSEFGNGPLNPHSSSDPGPAAGISQKYELAHPAPSMTHGSDVGVLVDSLGDYYVTSGAREIHVYGPAGVHRGRYFLGVSGPHAVPFVDSSNGMLFTGAEGGGFHAIAVDKTTDPYTLTLKDADLLVDASQSSPKRAQDGRLYVATRNGDVLSYRYDSGSEQLILMGGFSVGDMITGGIALYDVEEDSPREEVLVATVAGRFYVLDHDLTQVLWDENSGAGTGDEYYAGVTVAERGERAPVALLPIAARLSSGPNSGMLRAIDLHARNVAWEFVPAGTTLGIHEIVGSVAVLQAQEPVWVEPGSDESLVGLEVESETIGSGGVAVNVDARAQVDFDTDSTLVSIPDEDENSKPGSSGTLDKVESYRATFASTDAYLYGVELVTGAQKWSSPLSTAAYAAPVVDTDNVVYVGDGASVLHAVKGTEPGMGDLLWAKPMIAQGGSEDIVKLGIMKTRGLAVGTHQSAFAFFE